MSVNAAGTGGYSAAGQFAALAGLIRNTISIAYRLSFATLIRRSPPGLPTASPHLS